MGQRPLEETPWDDCKVAFDYTGDDDVLWDRCADKGRTLPPGWELCETDSSGTRMVAVFRVAGVPRAADGQRVRALLNRIAREK